MKRRDVINELEQSTVGHVDKQARPGSSVTMNAPTATPVLWLQPELYRIRDAAVVLGVSPRMVFEFIQSGAPRATRTPTTGTRGRPPVRIARADLLAFVDRCRAGSVR